jgi:hypothetical protein
MSASEPFPCSRARSAQRKGHRSSRTRTRAVDFIEFLVKLAASYPATQTLRIILDNHSAHLPRDAALSGDSAIKISVRLHSQIRFMAQSSGKPLQHDDARHAARDPHQHEAGAHRPNPSLLSGSQCHTRDLPVEGERQRRSKRPEASKIIGKFVSVKIQNWKKSLEFETKPLYSELQQSFRT